jgi:hypothetical protein
MAQKKGRAPKAEARPVIGRKRPGWAGVKICCGAVDCKGFCRAAAKFMARIEARQPGEVAQKLAENDNYINKL